MATCPRRRAASAVPVAVVLLVVVVVSAVGTWSTQLRPELLLASGWGSVLAVVAGTARHRPQTRARWWAFAAMLGLWTAADTCVHLGGDQAIATVLLSAGQAIALTLVLSLLAGGRSSARVTPWLELVIMALVAVLVVAQLVAVLVGRASPTEAVALAVAALDVALLGMLLRFVVSRPQLSPAQAVLTTGAVVALGFDLVASLAGQRVAVAGDALQIPATASFLLLGGAALLPSMVGALDPRAQPGRRTGSAQLLGLVPVVVVPPALWLADRGAGGVGLPTSTFVLTGALLAALGMLRGVTALRRSEHVAEHDALTGLVNRRGLQRAWSEREGAQVGLRLCLVDLDEFKAVNDTHGHEVGDALLQAVAAALTRAAAAGAVVARLGGDEFVVLLPGDGVAEDADRLLAALEEPVVADGVDLRTGASIGVVDVQDGTPLLQALTRADIAMYAAKAAGRGAVVSYEPWMRADVQHRQRLADDLRALLDGAPAAEVGTLVVLHQPLVQLADGDVVGSEALVRWKHPSLGLLTPDTFLGIARSSGLEVLLDAAVLELALAQLAGWSRSGLELLQVSVNLTPASLLDRTLADRVLDAVARHGLQAGVLRLEVTEHEELPASDEAAAALARLAAAGVRISLDDFGAGYTSLEYLRRFPVSLLKLDRSVIDGAPGGDLRLVAGIAAMADALCLDVLAEGVETSEQRAGLVRLGIRYGQGFLFARPLAAEEFAARALTPAVSARAVPGQRPAATSVPSRG